MPLVTVNGVRNVSGILPGEQLKMLFCLAGSKFYRIGITDLTWVFDTKQQVLGNLQYLKLGNMRQWHGFYK
ncbi:hypothetical protein QQP08_004525, partial [Theobroma cacao]